MSLDYNSSNNNINSNLSQNSQEAITTSTAAVSTSVNERGIPGVSEFPTGDSDLKRFLELEKSAKCTWILAYGKAWRNTKAGLLSPQVPPELEAMSTAIQKMVTSLEQNNQCDIGGAQGIVNSAGEIGMQNYLQLPLRLRGGWILFVASIWLKKEGGKPSKTLSSTLRRTIRELKAAWSAV